MARFTKGDRISDPLKAISLIIAGRYVFWNHKPQNPGWMISMHLHAIVSGVRRGIIYEAIDNKEPNQ